MDELSGMGKVLPWAMVAFIIGGLVSMGMPGLSGFIAEFPIFLGVWKGGTLDLGGLIFGLNPSSFYPTVAIVSVLAIIITAAYILRAVGTVFFGDYNAEKWHDMRPIMTIDKLTLVGFVIILVIIGMFPQVIAPIVQSGVEPVVDRLQNAQQATTFLNTVQTSAVHFLTWLGGA
jgi:NADH-quinone oxidoreductase subunit M